MLAKLFFFVAYSICKLLFLFCSFKAEKGIEHSGDIDPVPVPKKTVLRRQQNRIRRGENDRQDTKWNKLKDLGGVRNGELIEFVRWPHLRIFDGDLFFGDWVTGGRGLDIENNYELVDTSSSVQERAIFDGYFIAVNLTRSGRPRAHLHIFSTNEARRCLKGRHIMFAGDSYMKQMYIGMTDILLDKADNIELIDSSQRIDMLAKRQAEMRALQDADRRLRLDVVFAHERCSHNELNCIIRALTNDRRSAEMDAIVVNVLVHHYNKKKNKEDGDAEGYIAQLRSLFEGGNLPITWATGPSYDIMKVPSKYRSVTNKRPTDAANRKTLDLGVQTRTPTLDFFTLTGG
jgi:hypothetical protein